MNNRVVLLDDDVAFLKVLSYHVEKSGLEPITYVDPLKALKDIQNIGPITFNFGRCSVEKIK